MKTAITVAVPSNDEQAMHVFAGHISHGEAVKQARLQAEYPLAVTWLVWLDYASPDPTITATHLRWVARMLRREVWGV